MTETILLQIESLSAGYGSIDVLHDISISLKQGEFISIVGPNGAGKTSLFKTISGLITPSAGSITFMDIPYANTNDRNFYRIFLDQRCHFKIKVQQC